MLQIPFNMSKRETKDTTGIFKGKNKLKTSWQNKKESKDFFFSGFQAPERNRH